MYRCVLCSDRQLRHVVYSECSVVSEEHPRYCKYTISHSHPLTRYSTDGCPISSHVNKLPVPLTVTITCFSNRRSSLPRTALDSTVQRLIYTCRSHRVNFSMIGSNSIRIIGEYSHRRGDIWKPVVPYVHVSVASIQLREL